MNPVYLDTARLLTQVAPLVFTGDLFALKGGTAINLFVRDMPRLSVDLDLVFADHRLEREDAIAGINAAMRDVAEKLRTRGFQVHSGAPDETGETRLFVRRENLEVKVEVNTVMRGTVHPVRRAGLTIEASRILMADIELPVLSVDELYGSKLVAAMDRQHLRDLYDVMHLFRHGGITPGIRRCFVAYLACHNRPLHELLAPKLRDISGEYERTFRGMTAEPVELESLLAVRDRLVAELNRGLDGDERGFLMSLAQNATGGTLPGIEHLEQLPGLRWKRMNLERLAQSNPGKFEAQARKLEQILGRLG